MLSKKLQSAHPLLLALGVSALATGASYALPNEYSGSLVGLIFLFSAYFLAVPRGAKLSPAHFGLQMGGLLEPEALSLKRIVRESLKALLTASLVALIVLPFFYFGFQAWYHPGQEFSWGLALSGGKNFSGDGFLFDLLMGHLLVVALPEEAFFRGYFQSALDDRHKARFRFLGANLGASVFLVSALFALGHFMTTGAPGRLAVFFPSLLFCYLRQLTGGIGASIVLHAEFNVAAALLGRGFGLY